MELQFEPFNYPKELTQQRELFIECFPENIGTPVETERHYKWKFKSFPSKTSSYEYVAKIEDELVGYYASIPYPYIVNGKTVNAAMVCDVMTGLKARGKGVFTKLGVYSTDQFKSEGLAFSTGYPIRPEVIPGHKKAGWDFPFQIPMYGRFIKMNSFLKTRKRSFLIPFANLTIWLYNSYFSILRPNGSVYNFEIISSNELGEYIELNEFFEKWRKDHKIVLNKNLDFLKWRLTAPEKEYKIIIIKKDSNIIGYTILRPVEKENVPCLGILDFALLKEYKHASFVLMKKVIREAKEMKVELILMMMLEHQARELKIKRNGFLNTPYPFSFIIKQFDNSIDSNMLKDQNNWSLMWIDSDDL